MGYLGYLPQESAFACVYNGQLIVEVGVYVALTHRATAREAAPWGLVQPAS